MYQLRKSLYTCLILVIGVVIGSPQANAQSVSLRTARILQFQQHRGNFAQENASRLNGMILRINQNGTFAITFPNSNFSTMQGQFTVSGKSLILRASKTVSTGYTGYSRADLVAKIDVTSNGNVMTIVFASGSGTSAVINGSSFSSSSSNAYSGVVLLR